MRRQDLLRSVSAALKDRQLVWFGTRGDDAEGLGDVPELAATFSIVSPYGSRASVEALALEELTGKRVDLDIYELEEDDADAVAVEEMRARLARVLHRPSALVTYRPSEFLSTLTYARRDRCRYLGLLRDHQAAFEHKPWVETSIALTGIPHVPWSYLVDADQIPSLPFGTDGPMIVRPTRSTGGVGLARVEDANGLRQVLETHDSGYISVAPYIRDGLPLNVSGVVWEDGVTLHPASVQLIGIPALTRRPFGFCGNDFGAAMELETWQLAAIATATSRIGAWMGEHGYRGAFGVDFLLAHDGTPLFSEVNPRFQGSTHASCQISVENDESCVMLEHVAAMLGMSAPKSRGLRDLPLGGGGVLRAFRGSLAARGGCPPRPGVARRQGDPDRRCMPNRPARVTISHHAPKRVCGTHHGAGATHDLRLRPVGALANHRARLDRPELSTSAECKRRSWGGCSRDRD